MRRMIISLVSAAAIAALALAGCGGSDSDGTTTAGSQQAASSTSDQELSGSVAGAGSSAQAAAQQAWIAAFQDANPGVTLSYDPIGSGGGREQFIGGGTVYAGSDDALSAEELKGAQKRCSPGEVVEMPVYISPIAVPFNVKGVDELKLDPDTLAKIFAQKITSWNDPAIAKTNPGVDLPSERIVPVNRSDESGTTGNFTDYLSAVASDVWTYGPVETWPVKGGEAAKGTSGVVQAIENGEGTIGYADASQTGKLTVAKVKVGAGYVGPTPEAAAKIFAASKRAEAAGKYVFAYELKRDTSKSGTYPIVLASYELACTQYDSSQETAIVKGYLGYVISPEGQQAAAKAAGSAPLPASLRKKLQPAVDAVGGSAG